MGDLQRILENLMNVATVSQVEPQTNTKWIVHTASDWEFFAGADWLSDIMSVPVTDRFHAKQGRSIGRWTLERDGQKKVVYLKRHFVLSKHDARMAKLFPRSAWSPGLQEYEHLAWAAKAGIPVPKVAAVGELRGHADGLQSFIAVEELAASSALHEAIPNAAVALSTAEFQTWKHGLFTEIARLTWEHHRRHGFHQDLYLCHFYIHDEDTKRVPDSWHNRITMIDYHRLKRSHLASAWYQAKDLGQLLFSTYDVPGLGDADREFFLNQYRMLRAKSDALPWSWLVAGAKQRSANNRQTQQRRLAERAA